MDARHERFFLHGASRPVTTLGFVRDGNIKGGLVGTLVVVESGFHYLGANNIHAAFIIVLAIKDMDGRRLYLGSKIAEEITSLISSMS